VERVERLRRVVDGLGGVLGHHEERGIGGVRPATFLEERQLPNRVEMFVTFVPAPGSPRQRRDSVDGRNRSPPCPTDRQDGSGTGDTFGQWDRLHNRPPYANGVAA